MTITSKYNQSHYDDLDDNNHDYLPLIIATDCETTFVLGLQKSPQTGCQALLLNWQFKTLELVHLVLEMLLCQLPALSLFSHTTSSGEKIITSFKSEFVLVEKLADKRMYSKAVSGWVGWDGNPWMHLCYELVLKRSYIWFSMNGEVMVAAFITRHATIQFYNRLPLYLYLYL